MEPYILFAIDKTNLSDRPSNKNKSHCLEKTFRQIVKKKKKITKQLERSKREHH